MFWASQNPFLSPRRIPDGACIHLGAILSFLLKSRVLLFPTIIINLAVSIWQTMVGRHHWLNGHEFGLTPGAGDGQGGLACCSPWGSQRVRQDWVTELNWRSPNEEYIASKIHYALCLFFFFFFLVLGGARCNNLLFTLEELSQHAPHQGTPRNFTEIKGLWTFTECIFHSLTHKILPINRV